ncbi:DUF2523 family protein [Mannheimia indoligenes]|uniref:DUF2523 family protein n=1 Tax=Mannheimia indoligenes TaxID=3103145 RepID=UPI002FE50D19
MGKLLSAILDFIFKKTVPKFFLFFALFFLVAEFTPILIDIAGGRELIANLSSSFASLPSDIAYFLTPFRIDRGLELVISAYITRFIIRRIPLMG